MVVIGPYISCPEDAINTLPGSTSVTLETVISTVGSFDLRGGIVQNAHFLSFSTVVSRKGRVKMAKKGNPFSRKYSPRKQLYQSRHNTDY